MLTTTRSASSGAVASTSASSRGVNNRRTARFLSSSSSSVFMRKEFSQLLVLKSGGRAEENYPLPSSRRSRRGHFSVTPRSASASSHQSFENEEKDTNNKGEIFFPIAPGRRSDGKRHKKTEIHAISEPRKPSSSANEGKTGSRAKSSSHKGGKKKPSSSSSSNKRSPLPNGGQSLSPNGGDRSSSHYKPFTPTSSKVSNVRRKKFAPLIAGVADNVPLDELLEKYPNFADCLGPKKYDSGHFIRLYSDLVRCDRLGDAIDLLQRLSDAKVPCLNDTSCLLYTSPSPRDGLLSRMPSSA